MAKPLSPDLRLRIIRAVEAEGMSCRGAAARFGVAPSTAIGLASDWRSTGACEARVQGGIGARLGSRTMRRFLASSGATPDMTPIEIADHLFKAHGERASCPGVVCFADRRHITFKKNIARQRAGSAGRGRRTRGGRHLSLRSTPTGWYSLTRPEPRPRWRGFMAGQRRVAAVPHGHWKTTTFVGALRATRPSKAAARSIEPLIEAIAGALAAFTARECLNYFAAAGYDRV